MRFSSGGFGIFSRAVRLLPAVIGVCAAAAIAAPAASANNLFTLDPSGELTAPVVTDSSGNAYVAWERRPAPGAEINTTLFCKVPPGGTCTNPEILPLPGAAKASGEAVTGAFPVLGAASGVVYVVAPRYVLGDTLIWTSENGGETFSPAKKVAFYAEGSYVGSVLRNPLSPTTKATSDLLDVASDNSAVGFTEVGDLDSSPFSLRFETSEDGQGVSLGFTGSNLPVEAYWTFNGGGKPYEVHYYHLKSGSAKEEKNWSAPQVAASGYEPTLASGPDGLFLVSVDLASGEPAEAQPTVLEVRKYNESTNTFGAPVAITTIEAGVFSLFQPPTITESPNGTLYVAYATQNVSGKEIFAWESTDGGQSFHSGRPVATINGGYSDEAPRLAVAANGQAWLSYLDEAGVEVADLKTQDTLSTKLSGPGPERSGDHRRAGSLGERLCDGRRTAGSTATGTVTYEVFGNATCTGGATFAGTAGVSGGVAGPSAALALSPGKSWWRAVYRGRNARALDEPVRQREPHRPRRHRRRDLPVGRRRQRSGPDRDLGTSVTDQARLSGPLAAGAGGTVTYALYKNNKCTALDATSVEAVTGGVGVHSAAVKPKVGTYYLEGDLRRRRGQRGLRERVRQRGPHRRSEGRTGAALAEGVPQPPQVHSPPSRASRSEARERRNPDQRQDRQEGPDYSGFDHGQPDRPAEGYVRGVADHEILEGPDLRRHPHVPHLRARQTQEEEIGAAAAPSGGRRRRCGPYPKVNA